MPNQVLATSGKVRAAIVLVADISHSAVGTGTTEPQITNTILVTETNRIATTKTILSGVNFQHRTFYANANLPTTVEEVGWFMNGTGAANSGQLLVRALLNFVKGSQDLFLILQGDIVTG